jgi:hypothetical protein
MSDEKSLVDIKFIDKQIPIRVYNKQKNRMEWKVGEVLHRLDGPALIYPDGSFEWRRYGILHREKGPAMAWTAGSKRYLSDRMVYDNNGNIVRSSDDLEKYVEFHKGGYACLIDGKYHCTAGPAIRFDDGEEHWCINGCYHRDGDNPALIRECAKEGIKYAYYKNDKLHRLGKPAVIYHEGAEEWWRDGENIG